jgi:type IV secretory pathway TrbL component
MPSVPVVNPGMIDSILLGFTSVVTLGWTGITPAALWLLGQIATWYLISALLVSLTSIQSHFLTWVYKIAFYMIYVWILTNLRFLTNAFADTLVRAGLMISAPAAQILGVPPLTVEQFMMPSQVILKGWTTTDPLLKFLTDLSSSWYAVLMHLPTILTYDVGVLMPMWACYTLIAIHIVVVVILFQMVAIFALFFIPLGIYSGTAWIAQQAVNSIISSGVRLGVLAFVTGVMLPWVAMVTFAPEPGTTPGLWSALSGTAVALLMVVVSWHAPKVAAAYFGQSAGISGTTIIAAALAAIRR